MHKWHQFCQLPTYRYTEQYNITIVWINCLHGAYLNPLPHWSTQVLPHDPKARRLFVTSGGLKKVQEIKMEPGTALAEYINAINGCYPEEIVKYYSPGYSEQLLDRVEQYQPLNWITISQLWSTIKRLLWFFSAFVLNLYIIFSNQSCGLIWHE